MDQNNIFYLYVVILSAIPKHVDTVKAVDKTIGKWFSVLLKQVL